MSGGGLTDVHRMFLQVMMSRRVLSDREIRQTYSKLESGGNGCIECHVMYLNRFNLQVTLTLQVFWLLLIKNWNHCR